MIGTLYCIVILECSFSGFFRGGVLFGAFFGAVCLDNSHSATVFPLGTFQNGARIRVWTVRMEQGRCGGSDGPHFVVGFLVVTEIRPKLGRAAFSTLQVNLSIMSGG